MTETREEDTMTLDGWILVSVLGVCLAFAFGTDPREAVKVRAHRRSEHR